MEKIKIITDSACDMSREDEIKYGIDIMCFPITIGNESFYDRDITPQEYYKKMDEHEEMPVHSQLNVIQFGEKFMEYASQGYTDIFFVSINSYGSATYSNAVRARDIFYDEHPEYKDMKIRLVDSLSYSAVYGYPVIRAAQMVEQGVSADEIEKYLLDIFSRAEVYLACYTLKYCKRSGRISTMTAFAGELLGFKPIIYLGGDTTKTVAKVRGDANVVAKLADVVCERMTPDAEYCVFGARLPEKRDELAKLLTKRLGKPPVPYEFTLGGAVASNAGPDSVVVAIYK